MRKNRKLWEHSPVHDSAMQQFTILTTHGSSRLKRILFRQQEADVQLCCPAFIHLPRWQGVRSAALFEVGWPTTLLIVVICILCAILKKSELNKASLWWVTSMQRCAEHNQGKLPHETCCIQTPLQHHQHCLHCFDKPVLGKVRHAFDACTSTRKKS